MNKRVFDCFIFFNELDLLEIRFEECFDHVDYFVVCEATRTFRGAPKPLVFKENKARFAQYLPKVRHVVVDDMPLEGDAWRREFFQRNAVMRGIADALPEDIVVISDCDEIIKASTLSYLRNNEGYFLMDMPMYQFYMNMLDSPRGWVKPFAYSYALHEKVGDYNRVRQIPDLTFERFSGANHRIPSAGWHFTFLGGAGKVVEKLRAYSHAGTWQQRMLQPESTSQQMLLLKDVGGGRFLQYCDIDMSFPERIWRRQKQLTELGLIKGHLTRIGELRTVVAQFERDRDNLQGRNRYLEKELERITSKYQHELNVALGKPSTQSSISHWSIGKTKEEDARGGNDGCITSQYGFHTDEEENPWWLVDLGSVYLVNNVRIFNRHEVAHRLRHFSILGSTDGTDWTLLHRKSDEIIFGKKLDPYDVSFEGGTTARFIKVQLNGRGFLHFHECLVFGRSIHDGQTVPGDVQRMQAASHGLEPCIVDYLEGPGPHALELGRRTPRPGWLASDLSPEPGAVRIDVTKPFPIADNAFAFAYSEHMIEHVSFVYGQNMLKECFRVLQPGGVLRVVTPSIEFLLHLLAADRGVLEKQYTEWSIKTFVPQAPTMNPAFVFNHFVRGWGHQFIYNRDTLHHAFSVAGFKQIVECNVGESSHPKLLNLESAVRMPAGFFALESMIMEGTK